jgi:elongation factor G
MVCGMTWCKISGPLLSIAVEPKTAADREKLRAAFAGLAFGERGFTVDTHLETGRLIIGGKSETELEWLCDRLLGEFKVEATIGALQVANCDAVRHEVEVSYTHDRRTAGARQFAKVRLLISPAAPGAGNSFANRDDEGSVPGDCVQGVEMGIKSVMEAGPLAGFPVVDCRVVLLDGQCDEEASSALAFEIAARAGLREGMKQAGLTLLEPIMRVEVVMPGEYVTSVIGDLLTRRGIVDLQSRSGCAEMLSAFVPLSTMFGYGNVLGYLTFGLGKFSLDYAHHAPFPGNPDPDDLFPMAMAMRA